MPATLYYSPASCALSPHIALVEAKLDFKTVLVDLSKHVTADGQDFYKINPSGAVPYLVTDDGTGLAEGAAIVQWIAYQHGKHHGGHKSEHLAPEVGTNAHFKFLETLNTIATELHKGFGPFWFGKYGGNAGGLTDYAKAKVLKVYERFDNRLAKQDYLEGSQFTVADGYLFTISRWATASYFGQGVGLFKEIDLSGFKNIEAWYKRVLARPGVQAALKDEGLPQ